MSKEHDLTKSLAELGEMIDRNVSRIAMLEAERDAANIKADGLLEMSERLEATLARKQRAIDAAMEARRSGLTAAAVADILRPEATDAKPLPHGVSPVGKPQPSGDPGQLPTIGQHHPDDPPRSDDRAVRLVKILASLVRKHCTPVDADLLILDKIVAECDGGGR